MWITAKVNDETVGTRLSSTFDHAQAGERGMEVETSTYADVFEAVTVENAMAGERACTNCGMREDDAEGDGRRCPALDVCDDPECLCDETTDHYAHVIGDAYMGWFESARVDVDQSSETVTAELRVAGKRFRLVVSRLSEDVPDGGALFLEVPGYSGLRAYGESTTTRVITGTGGGQES